MAKYAGYEIEVGSEKLRVVMDADITAILEEEDG
jgi:co-chaperonin GroES (HSP10)